MRTGIAKVLVLSVIGAATAAAQSPFGTIPGSDCPAGMMPAPVAPSMGGMGGMMDPKAAAINAAKKKILGTKADSGKASKLANVAAGAVVGGAAAAAGSSTAAAAASAASAVTGTPRCLTPEQYAAEAQAQQSAAMKGAASAMLTATPVGMAVVGARAAAPVAGKVAGALGNRFRRGPSKDKMVEDLSAGHLLIEDISFDAKSETPKKGSDKAINTLIEALKGSTGKYVLKVTPESDGKSPADANLALKRAQLLAMRLAGAGIPAEQVTAAPLTTTTSWTTGAPAKSDARVELVTAPPPAPPAPPPAAAKSTKSAKKK